jgi:DNA-binding response OmpR family regulator
MNHTTQVLLVDEDRFVASILQKALQPDFKVVSVSNGIEAMDWLEKGNRPGLIISEVCLPYLDGHELVRLINGSNLFSDIPVLMLSVLEDSSTRIKCFENGADGYIMKPFNPMEVKAKARAILRRTQGLLRMVS